MGGHHCKWLACVVSTMPLALWASEPGSTRQGLELDAVELSAKAAAEQAQQAPASISALSRERLDEAGVKTLKDVSTRTPNFVLTNHGSQRFSMSTIRGIGSSIGSDYFNGTLGVFLDGVPLSNGEFFRRLGDLESVEVLRGPQGSLYGANSHSGVVRLTSRQPGNQPAARLHLGTGNHGQRSASLSAEAPLVAERVYAQVFVDHAEHDGFTRYQRAGGQVDDLDTLNGSAKLRFQGATGWSLDLSAALERVNQGSYAYLPFKGYSSRRVDLQTHNDEVRDGRSLSALWRYDLGWARLVSTSGWRDYEVVSHQDLAYNTLVAQSGGGRSYAEEWGRQYSQDLRLEGGEGGWSWTAGLFWQHEDFTYDYWMDVAMFGQPFFSRSEYETRRQAAYGETTFALLSDLDLTLGVRVAHERHRMDNNSPFSAEASYTMRTPKVALAYHVDEQRQLYVSATRGARSGGFDRFTADPAYDPESLWSYEAGFKSSWPQQALTFNAAVFYIDWRDLQVKTLTAPGQILTRNAARARSQGIELESQWQPLEGLAFSAFAGTADAKYRSLDDSHGAVRDGNHLINTPRLNGGLALQYGWALASWPAKAHARVEYQYVGRQFFDIENELEQGGYGLLNLRTGIDKGGLGLSLFVNNLLDKDYRTFASHDSWGFDYTVAGEPRTLGLALDWKL